MWNEIRPLFRVGRKLIYIPNKTLKVYYITYMKVKTHISLLI